MNTAQGFSAASTFVDVLAGIFGAQNQRAQYQGAHDAEIYNAAVARQRAELTRVIYGQREGQTRRATALELGRQRAAAAETGGGFAGGTTADVERQSAVFAELDALNVRYEGALEAYGYEEEARLHKYNARVARARANQAEKAGYIGIAGSLLGGAGDYIKAS